MQAQDLDLTPLWQTIADSIAEEVPMIAKALGTLVIAAIGIGARHIALVASVKREAVKVEREIGSGEGERKHERVRSAIKSTWPMARVSNIDRLISTKGKAAAHADREKRESLIPTAVRSKPPEQPN